MKRSLSLKKETLAQLTSDDMRAVGGGQDASALSCVSCVQCVIDTTAGLFHPSVFSPTNCCQGIPTFHRAGGAAC